MFDIAIQLMVQLVGFFPIYIGLWLIFDFLGSFFFGSR